MRNTRRAKDQVRRLVALYISFFPNIARETELPEDFVLKMRRKYQSGGMRTAAPLIGDEIVDLLMVAGAADECKARLD